MPAIGQRCEGKYSPVTCATGVTKRRDPRWWPRPRAGSESYDCDLAEHARAGTVRGRAGSSPTLVDMSERPPDGGSKPTDDQRYGWLYGGQQSADPDATQ